MIQIIIAGLSGILSALPQILTAAGVVVTVAYGLKIAFASFMIFVFPAILKKWFLGLVVEKITSVTNYLDGSSMGKITMEMTGLAAYLAQQTGLDTCFPMIISALLTSFVLKLSSIKAS